ncbi:hypothetical protein PC128_g10343 [Phytophthora cactorum]|nr:hypothetical protein PC128_g10343 [Phytophthora cactorum]
MVRNAFIFDDDNELVQVARSYDDADRKISWRDATHRMRHTGHASTKSTAAP